MTAERPRSLRRPSAGELAASASARPARRPAGRSDAWLVLAYLGSLAILLLNAFWESDAFSGRVVPNWTLDSFQTLFTVEVYRTIALRTIVMAIAVTADRRALAFPIAYYMARVASPRTRGPGDRGAHAALGVVPGQGLRLAGDPAGQRDRSTGRWLRSA